MKRTLFILTGMLVAALAPLQAADQPALGQSPLFTQEGSDLPFADALKSGGGKPGDKFSEGPVLGSHIKVNHEMLTKQLGKIDPIPKDIGLHTEVCGDNIRREDFPKWTRWYQEDGDVQIFRLFKGDQNIRGGEGESGSPGRVEAYFKPVKLAPGTWAEWTGSYTIVKPVGGCIFQLMHEGSLWSMHIDMTADGEIHFLRRHPRADEEKIISLARDMVGKSISFKVRGNGKDFEVYKKFPIEAEWTLVTKGSYTAAKDNKVQFRWGIYCGSKKGQSVPNDGMIFVTGVTTK